MKCDFSYKRVHGTDRGGEDVSLHVVLTTDVRPVHSSADRVASEAVNAHLADVPDNAEDRSSTNEGVWTEDGFVRTCESEYGFTVKHTVEKVREDVALAARDGLDESKNGPEWTQSLKTGTYTLEFDLYTHGNAE